MNRHRTTVITPYVLLFWLALALTAPLAATAQDAGQQEPRVAGIVLMGDKSLVFLESDTDESRTVVRVGQVVEGWGRIEEVTRQYVRLWTPDGERRVRLQNGLGAASSLPLPVEGIVLEKGETGGALQRTVATQPLANALTGFSSSSPPAEAAGTEVRPGVGADTGAPAIAELTARLKPLLGLPEKAQIVAIDNEPIDSAADAFTRIQTAMERGNVVRLSIDGVPDKDRVYLMPK